MSTPSSTVDAQLRSELGFSGAGAGGDEEQYRDVPMLATNEELRTRLQESEETLAAIRRGDVDALIVGDDIYILDRANAANNKLRNDVLAQMEDAVLAYDEKGHVIFMNAAAERQYARRASDVLGLPSRGLFQEQWPNTDERAQAEESLRTHGSYRANSIHVRADGTAIHVESTVSILREADGARVGKLAVIRDITERVHVEETLRAATAALKDADRRKDEFLAMLAHELRNPLAPIRNALQIMQLTTDPEAHDNARAIIKRQLGQMVHLVDDLLDVSRISQGKLELRCDAVDVAHGVQQAIETSRPTIDRRKHELIVRLPPPRTLMVDADLTRLCQIVANLLNNAAKYTPEHGRIEVLAERRGDFAAIVVRDSGIGIPRDMAPRIFEMFAQVDRALEHSQGGLGIGLALVKQLVEMHGGSVSVDSEGSGCGSSFTVLIPVLKGFSSTVSSPAAPAPHLESQNGIKVLVVDDNIDSAESLAKILQMMGYETHTEHDGVAAVSGAESFEPHAILLDIGLPKMNGIEAAKAIRRQTRGAKTLLIALSGWGQDADRRRTHEAGFDHHFVKPVNIDVLAELFEQLKTG